MSLTHTHDLVLEPASQALAEATAGPPFLYELSLAEARAVLDEFVRELAVGTGAAVVFVDYDRSPEAQYPVAIEQGYATAQWIVHEGAANQLYPSRIAVAGDSVGGNMTAALTLMAKERGDVRFVHQSMYYPVTDAAMDTGSYEQFAEGEAYAARLREAGTAVTTVRYDGITHDFLMLNPLSDTHATRAAIAQVIAVLCNALNTA
jgi:acetyl esterase/lipase